MLEIDRIYHADAFDVLPRIDDDSVDLIICDGPYGVTANSRPAAVERSMAERLPMTR